MYIDSPMACPTWRNPERASRYDLLVAKGNLEPKVLERKDFHKCDMSNFRVCKYVMTIIL